MSRLFFVLLVSCFIFKRSLRVRRESGESEAERCCRSLVLFVGLNEAPSTATTTQTKVILTYAHAHRHTQIVLLIYSSQKFNTQERNHHEKRERKGESEKGRDSSES